MSAYHHGWGTGLRNSLGLWGDSELAKAFKGIGIWHADDMSGILLDSVWRRVHGKDIDIGEQVEFYRAFWEENERVRDKPCPDCSETLEFWQSFPLAFIDNPGLPPSDYELPKFSKVPKVLQWYKCSNGHVYIRTSDEGFSKPEKRHFQALNRLGEADSGDKDPLGD